MEVLTELDKDEGREGVEEVVVTLDEVTCEIDDDVVTFEEVVTDDELEFAVELMLEEVAGIDELFEIDELPETHELLWADEVDWTLDELEMFDDTGSDEELSDDDEESGTDEGLIYEDVGLEELMMDVTPELEDIPEEDDGSMVLDWGIELIPMTGSALPLHAVSTSMATHINSAAVFLVKFIFSSSNLKFVVIIILRK